MTSQTKMKTSEILLQSSLLNLGCREYLARDAAGYPVSPFNEKAVCYCLMGAIQKVGGARALRNVTDSEAYKLLVEVAGVGSGGLGKWNDAHSTEERKALLETAAAVAQERGL